jgi:glycosyltransferase involved in cell wall biosynthesis
MITLYSVIFNEELLLPFMIRFYRKRFPDCKFIFYDNCSTDNSAKIAIELNCTVINYDTGGKFYDEKLTDLKNNCWKEATTDWVAVCDCDELVDISQQQLENESSLGSTIISTEAYIMVNMNDNIDIENMNYGLRAEEKRFSPTLYPYDKSVFFNKSKIKEINYGVGCHSCAPVGEAKNSSVKYRLYHFKYINLPLMVKRYRQITLSDENKENGYSTHFEGREKEVGSVFKVFRSQATKIIEHGIF